MIIMLWSAMLWCQYDHTPVFSELEGDALYQKVVDAYKPQVVLTYSMARDTLFANIDSVNDTLECAYTGLKRFIPPGEDPTQAVFLDGSDNGINTEHSYPRSKGAENGNGRSDMHHLYPTRVKTNSDRGSMIFADVNDAQTLTWYRETVEQSTIPTQDIDEWSELGTNAFEPRESIKGDVARSIMYFYTMYRTEADNADPNFFTQQRETLCDWHYDDPVDQVEWERSHAIAAYQEGKANPFVLDCSLAYRIYCDEISAECVIVDIDQIGMEMIQVYPNPASDYLFIMGISVDEVRLISITGSATEVRVVDQMIDIRNFHSGWYVLQLTDHGVQHIFPVIIGPR